MLNINAFHLIDRHLSTACGLLLTWPASLQRTSDGKSILIRNTRCAGFEAVTGKEHIFI